MEDRVRILEERIEGLTLEIARAINQAEVAGRPEIRSELMELAINVLRDGVVMPAHTPPGPTVDPAGFNPLGMGIPLAAAGAVLIVLFPPVGVMLFAAAIVMIAWGLMALVVKRR